MNAVDFMVFALLALADLALIVHLRRRRARIIRLRKMYHSLTLAVRRELSAGAPVGPVAAQRSKAAAHALLQRNVLKPVELARASAES